MSTPQALLRRYLRQRMELGEREIVLDRFQPEALAALLRERSPTAVAAAPLMVKPAAPAGMAPAAAPVLVPPDTAPADCSSLDELGAVAAGCRACALCEGRTQVVFGEGNPRAAVMVVGEAPGAEEDRTGRPFVGRAGKLLDLFLASIGCPRESVYICNVLKCRPPGNRNPRPEEIEACSGYLVRQVELVDPAVILAVGTFPAQTLLGSGEPIGRLRGRVHDYGGRPLVPTYHPAAVLRNPSWIRPVWEDLQRLREVLASA